MNIKYVIGQKLKVNKKYKEDRMCYPFMPDLVGKIGEVIRIQTEYSGEPLDRAVYWLRFEEFLVGIIEEGSCAFDCKPTNWRKETDWCFLDDYLTYE